MYYQTTMRLLMELMKWRKRSIHNNKVKFLWTDLHLSTIRNYLSDLHRTCDFHVVRFARLFSVAFRYTGPGSTKIRTKIASFFTKELHEFFRVPRLNMFLEVEDRMTKHQLLESFILFLVEFLYYQIESSDLDKHHQLDSLLKELRFILVILGDKSLMLCDEHEESKILLEEVEAVTNEAGSFVHSFYFVTNRSGGRLDERLCVVLNHIDLFKVNLIKFSNLLPCFCKSSFTIPKTCMVDLLIIDSVIRDLEDVISWEDDPIVDVKDQVRLLHQGLIFLQSCIKDSGFPVRPSEIGELREPLRRIGYRAHQIEYLINSLLAGDAPVWYLINRLTDINHKIQHEVQEITKKHKPRKLKYVTSFNAQPSLQAKGKFEVDDVTIGFEDRETYVLDELVGRGANLQLISIFGMGGLGKTTLAKKVQNHPIAEHWFDIRSWCGVSQKYERRRVLTDILVHIASDHLGKDRILQMGEEGLAEQIYKTLKRRRYLVVMDDIWDSDVWDDLQRCFPDDENGSRILITTRNKDVAPPNSIIYALPSLSNGQCWELLKKKVFGSETCPAELIREGKEIAAMCRGLPLGVVVFAGVLATMDEEKNTWQEVGRNLSSHIYDGGDNTMMQILELSYKHLPEHLKPCFLYFIAFPEGKEISVRKLTRLWISEGFIHKEEGKSAEDVAEEYLIELIDKSLVMVAKRRSDGGVKACVVHDLLRDLCFKICEEEDFLKEMGYYWKYLGPTHGHHVTWSYCQQIRSSHQEARMAPFYLFRTRLLRVMHFNYISDDIIGINYLVNLRYLVVRDLPTSIGNLVNLEYLRLGTHNVVHLPQEIFRMKKLRYLKARLARYRRYRNSFQKNRLKFLSCITIRKLEDAEMLKYSPDLFSLKCMVKRISPSSSFDLRHLTQLESLKLMQFGAGMIDIGFPSRIKTLSLYDCMLPWEKMSVIGRMKKLEVLTLGFRSFEGERWDTREGEFQMLVFMKLDRIQHLTEWNVESSDHFPRLQRLVLNDCGNLQEVPCGIGEGATLKMIEVKGQCKGSLVESAKGIQEQQLEMGNEELRVVFSTAD